MSKRTGGTKRSHTKRHSRKRHMKTRKHMRGGEKNPYANGPRDCSTMWCTKAPSRPFIHSIEYAGRQSKPTCKYCGCSWKSIDDIPERSRR